MLDPAIATRALELGTVLRPVDAVSLFVARTGYTGEDGFEIMLPVARRRGVLAALRTPASRRAASARATRCGSKPA